MMAESKSTDKLRIINDIVETTLKGLTPQKRDQLISMEINWDTLNLGFSEGFMPVPNLKLTFKE
jgi:hypothetical protein